MNFEQPNIAEITAEDAESIETKRDHEMVELRNSIQRELLAHECPPDDNWSTCVQNWADSTAAKFDLIFDKMHMENPNLGAEWEKSKSQILDDIHGKILEMHDSEEVADDMRMAA